MKTIKVGNHEFELGKFHPCLVYNEGLGCLSVHLRDCSYSEFMVTNSFDLLYINHSKKKKDELVGFTLWGVHEVLGEKGYTKSSISLENLINRFDRFKFIPLGQSAFGRYKDALLAIAREHQFVWHIPPTLLCR